MSDTKYKNPTPSLDDEYVANEFTIAVRFNTPMTLEDATKNIESYVKAQGLPEHWVHMGQRKLCDPAELNGLKESIGERRIYGKWLNLANQNNHIHCECSICGHREEAINAVVIGRSSDEYIGVKYKFCPKCGSSMCTESEAKTMRPEKTRIDTPYGRLESDIVPDGDYPGIALTAIDDDGKEISCAIMEWNPIENCYMLRVYSYEDPDGDPKYFIAMSDKEKTN